MERQLQKRELLGLPYIVALSKHSTITDAKPLLHNDDNPRMNRIFIALLIGAASDVISRDIRQT
eukprot:SAG31_NODE_1511_length_8060_cov_3.005653_3_plen_64_part_00